MTIWIDLDNSPHVPLFAPIIRHYRESGVNVTVTAREHAQTVELLDLHGFGGTYTVIGKHHGRNKLAKAWGLIVRASQLGSFIADLKKRPRVAVSHGSRSMVLAARWLRIPVITMYDYEWTETRIFNRFSTKVLVPDAIPDSVLDDIGLSSARRVRYGGIKEELYLRTYRPNDGFRKELLAKYNVPEDILLAVVRPPATTANYHDARGEALFDAILDRLGSANDVFTAITPRTAEQADKIRHAVGTKGDLTGKFVILDAAVDGLDLINSADLVISGGGTMNREAVLLGVPVYSFFAGRKGSLDKQMESEGLITFISDKSDVTRIRLERRRAAETRPLTDRVEKSVIEEIDRFLT